MTYLNLIFVLKTYYISLKIYNLNVDLSYFSFQLPHVFHLNNKIQVNHIPSFELKTSVGINYSSLNSIHENYSQLHFMLESIKIIEPGDKFIQFLLQILIGYPHILLPVFIHLLLIIINNISLLNINLNFSKLKKLFHNNLIIKKNTCNKEHSLECSNAKTIDLNNNFYVYSMLDKS